jgi:hypothetical protein
MVGQLGYDVCTFTAGLSLLNQLYDTCSISSSHFGFCVCVSTLCALHVSVALHIVNV